MKIEVLANADAIAGRAAALIAAEARSAAAAHGCFIMAVSGGHTPWLMLRPSHAGRSARPASRGRALRAHASRDCRLAAGPRPCPPRSRSRRPHRLAGARRSGSRCHRRGCGADRGLPGETSNDVDVPHHKSVSAHFVAGERQREGWNAPAPARWRSVESGRTGSPGPGLGHRRPRGRRTGGSNSGPMMWTY